MEQDLKLSSKNLLKISILCLSLRLTIMIGSSFSLSEGLVYFEDFQALLDSENSILHTFFATVFRTAMPIYLFPAFYYIDRDFFKKRSLSLGLFYLCSLLLIFNNILIYGFGAYSFIAMKSLVLGTLSSVVRAELITHYEAVYNLVQMILNEVINAIYVPALEILRGASLIMIFKKYEFNKKYLLLGIAIILFDSLVLAVQYLSFLGFEFTLLPSLEFTEYAMISFQYWIVIGLSYLIYKEWKEPKRLYS